MVEELIQDALGGLGEAVDAFLLGSSRLPRHAPSFRLAPGVVWPSRVAPYTFPLVFRWRVAYVGLPLGFALYNVCTGRERAILARVILRRCACPRAALVALYRIRGACEWCRAWAKEEYWRARRIFSGVRSLRLVDNSEAALILEAEGALVTLANLGKGGDLG